MSDMLKRGFDVAVSGLALVFAAPFLALIALMIRLDSPGRVFFLPRRVGQGLSEFRIVKFRTMVERDPDAIDQHAEVV